MSQNDQLVQNAFKNAKFLMILQIFAKVTTMSLNFVVARFVQKDIYGYSNKLFKKKNQFLHQIYYNQFIQLQLFYSMILFFSKEALRRACQREVQMSEYDKQTIHQSAQNMVIYCFPIQLIMSIIIFSIVQIFYFQHSLKYFTITLILVCLSALIENLCEPFYVQLLLKMDMTIRVKAEGLAIFFKSVMLYVFLKLDLKLLAFGLAQLCYCLTIFIIYNYLFMRDQKCSIKELWSKYYQIQTCEYKVKEKSLDTQAEFGLISNLISIVCRFVFQPIEEMAFNLFSKFKKQSENIDDGKDPKQEEQSDSKVQDPLYVLAKITQFLCFIGFGMIIFGIFFSRMFIRIVYTEKWATESAHQIMIAYCIYTLFMAINGVTEAFIII